MVITVSAVVLLLILFLVLLRTGFVRLGSACVCILLGFFLASTGIAPTVNHAVASIVGWLNHTLS